VLSADLIGRMMAQISLGVPKEEFEPPLTGEAERMWDQLTREIDAIKAAGGDVEPSTPDLPDLPKIKRPPEQEGDAGG
jgi:hypothetical protein